MLPRLERDAQNLFQYLLHHAPRHSTDHRQIGNEGGYPKACRKMAVERLKGYDNIVAFTLFCCISTAWSRA
jgi:hypothetical protein